MKYSRMLHDKLLVEYHSRGLDDRMIAARLAVSKAAVIYHLDRLGLESNPSASLPDLHSAPPPPKERPNPLAQAKAWLGDRLVEKPGGYWLDGLPVNLDAIMRAYNRMLAARGAEQVSSNPRWSV